MNKKMFLIAGGLTAIVAIVMFIDLIKNYIDSSSINIKDIIRLVGMCILSAVSLFGYFKK